ncbi:DegV family protein [Segniliparus rugosus]|uniref:DegV family EDD domain-containing protein n=1 Tax=Segniliparus rugosus (strain ATCC BAA-974 / DSM 45345 / CCUG 50838 / CIP 108380 / JCM 13579 / CDC 945) TaxID=679197 RepID=E5XMJ3_SEGRC|nr:DegV family protein [Segniliparus rugosus]EFV14420.1 DegV family EDD domain-containing protein [Segniliparus rugosus ATCC BAA-974]
MTVRVVTDSACCLSADQLAAHGIRQAALHVLLDGRAIPEDDDNPGSDDGFGEDWLTKPGLSTAAANEEELVALYEKAFAESSGDGVVAVHLSGALSATATSAQKAARRVGAVVVVDSRQAAMGVGFAALAAARAASGGAALDEVAEIARRTAEATTTWGFVDKLDWLRRSGRIPRTTWLVGTALSIRPVLRISDGKLQIAERTRTRAKALDKLVELAKTRFGDSETTVAIRHQQAEEQAAQLAEALSGALRLTAAVDIGPVNRVLGAHLGTGALVLSGVSP